MAIGINVFIFQLIGIPKMDIWSKDETEKQ